MSSGWGNDPGGPGSGSGQPTDQGTQPGNQGQTQPGYGSPTQPAYGDPSQPGYGGPTQPGYGAPTQPGYQGPSQPDYPNQTQFPAPPPQGYGAPPPPPGYGVPGQPGYPTAPPPNKRPAWLGTAVVAIIVVLVVGGFFLFRDRLSNDVTSLAVGECFDTPSDQTAEVSDVQRQPCNEPHDAEVIASLTHPAPASEPYPVVSGFDDYIEQNCVPAFNSYTGRDYDTDFELGLNFFRPTQPGWADGDRGFTCFVVRVDEAKLSKTIRNIGPASP